MGNGKEDPSESFSEHVSTLVILNVIHGSSIFGSEVSVNRSNARKGMVAASRSAT